LAWGQVSETPRLLLLHLTTPKIKWRPGAGFEPARPYGTEGASALASASSVSPPRAGFMGALSIPSSSSQALTDQLDIEGHPQVAQKRQVSEFYDRTTFLQDL
jgi:hypothetical protein